MSSLGRCSVRGGGGYGPAGGRGEGLFAVLSRYERRTKPPELPTPPPRTHLIAHPSACTSTPAYPPRCCLLQPTRSAHAYLVAAYHQHTRIPTSLLLTSAHPHTHLIAA